MSRSCIVVEDSRAVAGMVIRALGDLGYATLSAERIEAAAAHLARERPELVLLDLMLPGASRAEAIRLARQTWPQAVIVAMSAGDASQPPLSLLIEARAAGAHLLLAKPFPLAKFQETIEQAALLARDGPGRGHVLVVDDSRTVLAVARKALMGLNYRVSTAASVEQALIDPTLPTVDCLVTDLFFAGQSGLDAVTHVRAHWPAIAVVAMSGGVETQMSGQTALRAAETMGADATLQKPFTADALDSAIVRALRAAEARADAFKSARREDRAL